MKSLFATALLLAAWSPAASAQDTAPVPRVQTQTFALAYTLRLCDLRAQTFVQSVKGLKDVDDDGTAGAEVVHLSRQSASLRHRQAMAYTQAAQLLEEMGAPRELRQWADQTAVSLDAPLIYSGDAKTLAKTEPETALTLAELGEIQTLKALSNAQQPSLNTWLKLSGGRLALWTSEVGRYAADMHNASQTDAPDPTPSGTARRLLQAAPPDSPSEVRGDLSELIPRGGGNLQVLATVTVAGVSPEKMTRVSEKLLDAYGARSMTEVPEKAE